MLEVTSLNTFFNSTNIFPSHLAYSVLQYVDWIERCIFEQILDYLGLAYHFLTFLTVCRRALFMEGREFLQLLFQGIMLNHSVSNSRVSCFWGIEARRSTPKWTTRFFFQKNSAMAALGLKEMGKFLWEGRERGLPCWLSQFSFAKLRQPTGQTFFPTFPKEFSHFLQTKDSKVQLENAKKSLVSWKVGWTPCLFSS